MFSVFVPAGPKMFPLFGNNGWFYFLSQNNNVAFYITVDLKKKYFWNLQC